MPKFKIWFPTEPFFDKFCKDRSDAGLLELARRMQMPAGNLKKVSKPGTLIRESTADAYAIRVGYHPSMIWPDWFDHEPEEGSNPKKRKPLSKGQDRIVYIDTTQPSDYNQ